MFQIAGEQHGKQAGWDTGYEMGHQRGLELGRELGQHRGRVATLLELYAAQPAIASDRMRSTLNKLNAKLQAITLDDPLDQQCFDELEDVRAKMRMVDVWIRSSSNRASSASGSVSQPIRGGLGIDF